MTLEHSASQTLDSFATDIVELQQYFTDAWHQQPNADLPNNEFAGLLALQHKQNFQFWQEDGRAQDTLTSGVSAAQIEPRADRLNQQRIDMITQINLWLQQNLLHGYQDGGVAEGSETLGSIIDRLSMASLKVYQMREQAELTDESITDIENSRLTVTRLQEQHAELAYKLQCLINDLVKNKI